MRMLRLMCGVTKLDNEAGNERKRGQQKWGKSQRIPGKEVEVVWAGDEKRGTLRKKEGGR